jgi:hypothetical protein
MKKYVIFFIFLLVAVACTEENTLSFNGFWQLKTVENTDGTIQKIDTVFLGFQSRTLFSCTVLRENYRQSSYVPPSYGYITFVSEDSISLKLADGQDPYSQFKDFWHTTEIGFYINSLTTNKLILSNENGTYNFEKN